LKENKEQT